MTTGPQPSEAITRSWSNKIKHKINTSSVLLQVFIRGRVRVRGKVRIRVRIRVTKLVYQIGFTTPF